MKRINITPKNMNLAKKPPAINSVPNKLLYLPGVNGMLPNKSILKQY